MKLSIPSTVMMCAEWWAFEILSILAGILGVVELASQTINFNMIALLFMIPLGIQEATCAIIGNCIGANNVPLAKRFFSMINKIITVAVLIISVVTFLAREQIAACFTGDPEVREMSERLIMVTAFMIIFDGAQGYLQGPIRALGLQQRASYFAITSYWVIAIPISLIFSFWLEIGVIGLSIGISMGVLFQFVSYLFILLRQNW